MMRVLLVFLALCWSSFAFGQAALKYPNYSSTRPVPRAFADVLSRRGVSAEKLYQTMNGIAQVAANDNAAVAAAADSAASGMRVGSWLGMGLRAGSLAARTTAAGALVAGVLDIGIEGYHYFYGPEAQTARYLQAAQDDAWASYQIATPSFPYSFPDQDLEDDSHNKDGSCKSNSQTICITKEPDDVIKEWVTAHFRCSANAAFSCALAEAKLGIKRKFSQRVNQFKDHQFLISGYTSKCVGDSQTGENVNCSIKTKFREIDTSGNDVATEGDFDGYNAPAAYKGSPKADVEYKPAELPCVTMSDDDFSSLCGGDPSKVQLPAAIPYPIVEIPFHLPADVRTQPVYPEIPAKELNDLWKRAADAPDYQGEPYPTNDPASADELKPYKLTVGDLSEPFVSPSASEVPWAPTVNPWPKGNPNTSSSPSGSTSSGSSTAPETPVHLSEPDPGVSKPSDPDVPTIDQILGPIFKLRDKAKDLKLDLSKGECPEIKFTVSLPKSESKEISTTVHCDAADKYREPMGAMFLVVYALYSLFVILTA